NKATRDKYIQIFALYKQGIPTYALADKFSCGVRAIQKAIQWCTKNAINFTSAEHLKIQLEKIRELRLEARQKLRKLQEGTVEKTVKKHYGQEVESVERQRFNVNAEVGLLRLIKDLTAEESTLLGVYDACVEEEDIARTVEDLRKLLG
ncbi:MAG: hypothetical protein ACYSTS_19575, partial [Planctomycetota bacterium]